MFKFKTLLDCENFVLASDTKITLTVELSFKSINSSHRLKVNTSFGTSIALLFVAMNGPIIFSNILNIK